MNLSPADSERFYRIWWPLLTYINDRTNLAPDFPKKPITGSVKPQDALAIRNALWDSRDYLQGFINDNPVDLDEDDLELAASWERRVAGRFIIMRHLKKHSIFLLQDSQPAAFGVLGIISPIDDILPFAPPVMADAVLLPFEGKIIIDSLLAPYSLGFGGGIRRDLSQQLRRVTELGGLITSLDADDLAEAKAEAVVAGNRKILAEFRKDLVKSGLSEKMVGQHFAVAETFVKTHLLDSRPRRSLLEITAEDLSRYFASHPQAANRVSFKRLVKFLANSERIDWDEADAMEDFLKTQK